MRYAVLIMVNTVIMIWDELPCSLADRYKFLEELAASVFRIKALS
jgi:hypothetical protein